MASEKTSRLMMQMAVALARYNEFYEMGARTTLYGVQYKWPMHEDERQLFHRNLRLAGVH